MIYDQVLMIFRALLLSICVLTAHAQDTSPGKSVKVQLLMWNGAFTPNFDSVRSGKSERVLFRKDVGIGPGDLAMRPLELLKKHLDIPKLKDKADFYWRGAVYRPTADGKSASLVYDRGSLRNFNLTDLKEGDMIVYFRETF